MGLARLFTRPDRDDKGRGHNRVISDIAFGSNLAGLGPSFYQHALTVPGAFRAATLLADLVGELPWRAHRRRGPGDVEVVRSPLLDQPSYPDTRIDTFSAWTLDLLHHGNAFGIWADRDADGYPRSVLPVSAALVGVQRTGPAASSLFPTGQVTYQVGERQFRPDQVLHVKGPARPGELRGRGVLELHLDTVDLAREQRRQAGSLSEHGVPTGTLKSSNDDLTEPEAENLKRRWLAAQRNRSIAVLNSTTEFKPLAWNPEELQLVEARKFTLHELALIYGVPLYFLGAEGGTRTYSNVEQEGINLLKFTLAGHLTRFEQALSQAFPRGTTVKADTDAILRTDTLTRYQAHSAGITAGFLTPDEARAAEDRPPLTPSQREALGAAPRPAGPGATGGAGEAGPAGGEDDDQDDVGDDEQEDS